MCKKLAQTNCDIMLELYKFSYGEPRLYDNMLADKYLKLAQLFQIYYNTNVIFRMDINYRTRI